MPGAPGNKLLGFRVGKVGGHKPHSLASSPPARGVMNWQIAWIIITQHPMSISQARGVQRGDSQARNAEWS